MTMILVHVIQTTNTSARTVTRTKKTITNKTKKKTVKITNKTITQKEIRKPISRMLTRTKNTEYTENAKTNRNKTRYQKSKQYGSRRMHRLKSHDLEHVQTTGKRLCTINQHHQQTSRKDSIVMVQEAQHWMKNIGRFHAGYSYQSDRDSDCGILLPNKYLESMGEQEAGHTIMQLRQQIYIYIYIYIYIMISAHATDQHLPQT